MTETSVTPRDVASRDGSTAAEAQISAALARCAAGDQAALKIIYDLEAPRLTGVAFRLLRRRDLAEEAVHDAFLRVWRGAGTYDPARGAARGWLYAVVRNQALSLLRDEGRFEPAEPADLPDNESEAAFEALSDSSALRRCLQQLDTGRRRAILLAYVHGFSHGELAGRLGMPLGTVKSWIRRGLASLQACLG